MSFVESKGLKVFYKLEGNKGRDVVLLHGWGQNTDMMAYISTYLSNFFKVYSFDFPNFGQSDELKEVYGVEEYMECLKEAMDKLDIKEPIIIAHSFGCRVAIRYAYKYPVYKMVLTGAAGIKTKLPTKALIKQKAYKTTKKILVSLHQDKLLEELQNRSGSEDYKNASGILRQSFVKIVNDDVSDLLPSINVETLIVHGENDDAVPLSSAKLMEKLLPNAGLAIFEGADHFAYFYQHDRFNAVLYAFLKDDIND